MSRRRIKAKEDRKRRGVDEPRARLHSWVPHEMEPSPARWRNDNFGEFDVTVGIPWCNTPREVIASAQLCLAQEGVRVLVVLVDCGSKVQDHELVEKWVDQQPDVEMHTLRLLNVKHPSDFPAIAMDLVTARCQTEWLFCTHADVYLKRRDVISEFIEIADAGCPNEFFPFDVIGYRISPRPYEGWEKQVSHTATLLRMEKMLSIGLTWNQRRAALRKGWSDHSPENTRANWPDTEIMLNEILDENGIRPLLIDRENPIEENREINEDHRLIHARSLTSAKLARNHHYDKMKPLNERALEEANARIDEWKARREIRQYTRRTHQSAFDAPLILERKTFDPNLPILVTGMGQGGTTALMRSLSAGLTEFVQDFTGDSKSAEGQFMLAATGQISMTVGEVYDENSAYYGGKWIAKMPGVLMADKFKDQVDPERFNVIVATRDPLAKLLSLRRQLGAEKSDPEDQFRVYRRNIESAGSIFVPFENLITKTEATLAAIARWSGVEKFDLAGAVAEVVPNDPRYWKNE